MGGRTAEHEISVESGKNVVKNLDLSKYNVKPITITREGAWLVPEGYLTDGTPTTAFLPEHLTHDLEGRELVPVAMGTALDRTVSEEVDVVFIAMHGPYGEDGTVQGLLEILNLPYTGSNVEASAISMNKIRCKEIYVHHRIPTPRHMIIEERDWHKKKGPLLDRLEKRLGFPCVTKPPRLGSSVGVSIASDRESFFKAAETVFRYDTSVLIEEFIPGLEITSPVLDHGPGKKPTTLPLVESVDCTTVSAARPHELLPRYPTTTKICSQKQRNTRRGTFCSPDLHACQPHLLFQLKIRYSAFTRKCPSPALRRSTDSRFGVQPCTLSWASIYTVVTPSGTFTLPRLRVKGCSSTWGW